MPYDVFISYASTDVKLAESLYNKLCKEGFKIWFDKARLSPGYNWYHEIEQGCESSRVVLPLLTQNWKNSDWTKYETYGAEAIVPILIEGKWSDVSTPPLERFQAEILDMKKPGGPDWLRLFEDIRRVRDNPLPEKTVNLTHIHYRANEYFTGREKELIHIHEELHCNPKTAFTQGRVRAITAMGGAGKTTLVRQYAEKFWRCYPQIFWVDCRIGLEQEFAEIHDFLFPDRIKIGLEDKDKAASALHKLNSQETRLLILDNAEDEKSIMDWIPKAGGCHTLITSRFTGWSAAIKTVGLVMLNEESAIELLLKRSNRSIESSEMNSCKTLAKKLGYLPLALEQAAAYIQQQGEGFGFADYLQLYEEATLDLLAIGALGSTEYPDPVATTWKPTIEKLSIGARTILKMGSFFASTPIMIKTLIKGEKDLLEYIQQYETNNHFSTPSNFEFWIRQEVNCLKDYSMVKSDGKTFLLHPLIQTIQFHTISKEEQRIGWKIVTKIINNYKPIACWKEDCREQWTIENQKRWEHLFPHIKRFYELIDKIPTSEFEPSFHLLLCNAYASMDEFNSAITISNSLIENIEEKKDEYFSIYIDTREALAYLLRNTGKYNEAVYEFRTIYNLLISQQNEESINSLRANHNIACTLKLIGEYKKAESIMKKVLEQRLKILGENHYDTMTSTHDLGWVLMDIEGRIDESEQLILKAMNCWKKSLGIANPDTRAAFTNLALIYRRKGDYTRAENIQKELLESTKQVLGPNHLVCYSLMHNLSLFVGNNGRYQESFEIISEVLKGYKQYLPPDHRDMLTAIHDLGTMLGQLKRYDEAEPLLREALAGYERTQGFDTADTLRTVNNLADLLEKMGKTEEAKPYWIRSIQARKDKPDITPLELRQMAGSCLNLNEYNLAINLLHQVLESNFEIPGTHCHLARIYILTNRLTKVKEHINLAWKHRKEAPKYVVARILWFRFALALIRKSSTKNFIGQLKTTMQEDDVHMEWKMGTVLNHIKPKINEKQYTFLSSLVAAMSNHENLGNLNDFEAWRDAKLEVLK